MKFNNIVNEMHNGVLPGVSTATTLAPLMPNDRKEDMKKQNQRNSMYNPDEGRSFKAYFDQEDEMVDDEVEQEEGEYSWDDPNNPAFRNYVGAMDDVDDDEEDERDMERTFQFLQNLKIDSLGSMKEEALGREDLMQELHFILNLTGGRTIKDLERNISSNKGKVVARIARALEIAKTLPDGDLRESTEEMLDQILAILDDEDDFEEDFDGEEDFEDDDMESDEDYEDEDYEGEDFEDDESDEEDFEDDDEEDYDEDDDFSFDYDDEDGDPRELNFDMDDDDDYESEYDDEEDYDDEDDEDEAFSAIKDMLGDDEEDSDEEIDDEEEYDEDEEIIFDQSALSPRELRKYLQRANRAEEEEYVFDEMPNGQSYEQVKVMHDEYESGKPSTNPRFDRLINQLSKVSNPEDDCGCEYSENEEDLEAEEDPFDRAAGAIMSGISDEDIEEIDGMTGEVARWWREQVVKKTDAGAEVEEEAEEDLGPTKIDRARPIFRQLIAEPDITRAAIIEELMKQLDLTESSAISYYQRLAKQYNFHPGEDQSDEMASNLGDAHEFGPEEEMTEFGDGEEVEDDIDEEPELKDWEDPDRAGLIRVVQNAHLVYKRQSEDGSFEELWSYNIGDDINDELKIRRDILSGTDIPQNKTRSEDGDQQYTLSTMGNAQIIHITGLSN